MNETCDRCGFKAYVTVMNEDNLTLSFCKHHFEQNEVTLMADGWISVIDDRALLYPVPVEVEA